MRVLGTTGVLEGIAAITESNGAVIHLKESDPDSKTRRRTPDVRLARPTAPGTRVETEPDLLAGPFKGKTKLFEL